MATILTDHGHLQIYSPSPPPRSSQALGSDSKPVAVAIVGLTRIIFNALRIDYRFTSDLFSDHGRVTKKVCGGKFQS